MNGTALLAAFRLPLSERLGHRTIGQLAFGPCRDRELLAVCGTPEEREAARRVLNAIAVVGRPALEDELAVRRARRDARGRGEL